MLQVVERTEAGFLVLWDSKKILRHLVDGEFQRAAFEVYQHSCKITTPDCE